jgi:hypothetical protein
LFTGIANSTMSDLRLLDKTTKAYRKFLLDPGETDYFERKQLRVISEEARRPGVMDFKREVPLLTSMGIYSTWRGMVGSVKIADGDSSGWTISVWPSSTAPGRFERRSRVAIAPGRFATSP